MLHLIPFYIQTKITGECEKIINKIKNLMKCYEDEAKALKDNYVKDMLNVSYKFEVIGNMKNYR